MQLQDFPFELLLQVLSNLNYKDIVSFVQCYSALYNRSMQDSFWFDLCRLHGIHYCHPESNWRELYQSNELAKMCPHLNKSLYDVIPEKKQLLWTTRSLSDAGNYMLCLHPSCSYFGDAEEYDAYHCHLHQQQGTKHAIVLKLSPLHTLELWCNSCVKAIGFDGFAAHVNQGLKTEHYFMKKLVQEIATFDPVKDSNVLQTCIQKGRQSIELGLYQAQFRHSNMHIVNKEWHDAWLAFISGKSTVSPGTLTNEKLFISGDNGNHTLKLDPTLTLGKDFELVGSLTRWYIERVYGVKDNRIISANDLPDDADYCRMIHKIKIRQQINQANRYPPYVTLVE